MKAYRKLTALAVLGLAFVLAACGGGGKSAGETASSEEGMVYTASFQPVRDNTEAVLTPLLYTEEGLYASSFERVEESALKEGASAYETRYLFIPYGGEPEALDYTPAAGVTPAEGETVTNSGAEIAALFQDEDGTLLALERSYASVYAGPEGLTEDSENYWQYVTAREGWSLRRLGADLSAAGEGPLKAPAGGRFEPDRAVLDGEGNLALAYSGDAGPGVLLLSPAGEELRRVETENLPVGLLRLADGRAAMLDWGGSSLTLRTLDGTDSWPVSSDAWSAVSGAGDWDLCYTKGTHLYGYDLAAGRETPLLDWIVCGVDSGSLYGLNVSPEGTVRAMMNTWTGEEADGRVTVELVTLEKKSAAALPEKTVLTLAGQYTSSSLREAVLNFNRRSQTARIEIRDYSELNTDADYYAGIDRLTTEILAGQMPDLFITEDLPYAQLAAKGLLEDLYPWIDRDEELNREDLFANVLRALEVDGGLYQVNSGFSIVTAAGDRALVGDGGMTYERAEELLAAMPEGSTMMGMSGIREDVFVTCLALELDRLVDWKTGECRFDGEDFIRMLEFIKACPSQGEMDYGPQEESERELLAQGRQLLYVSGIHDFQDIQLIESCFPGREVAYPGFPTGDGSRGSALILYGGLAMSSACADKEAAWDFLRTFLLPQSGRRDNGLPLNKAAFEKSLRDACTPVYQTDAQGRVLLDEKGEPVEQSRGSTVSDDGSSQQFYALTEKQAETARSLAESVDTLVEINQGLMEIVFNESQAFFSGQKTAQETAKLIQSKAGIYLSEHS